eukprot:Rmarinus@m.19077
MAKLTDYFPLPRKASMDSPSSSGPKKILRKRRSQSKQLYLDFGQEDLVMKKCATCGMVYTPGVIEDDNAHRVYHAEKNSDCFVLNTIPKGAERYQDSSPGGDALFLCIRGSDIEEGGYVKILKMLEYVDEYLGTTGLKPTTPDNAVFLSVHGRRVQGLVHVERIRGGCRLVTDSRGTRVCLEKPERATCGVLKMWTDPHHRKHGVMRRLLDATRRHFIYGYVVSKAELAFTQLSDDGAAFAHSYCDSHPILVYRNQPVATPTAPAATTLPSASRGSCRAGSEQPRRLLDSEPPRSEPPRRPPAYGTHGSLGVSDQSPATSTGCHHHISQPKSHTAASLSISSVPSDCSVPATPMKAQNRRNPFPQRSSSAGPSKTQCKQVLHTRDVGKRLCDTETECDEHGLAASCHCLHAVGPHKTGSGTKRVPSIPPCTVVEPSPLPDSGATPSPSHTYRTRQVVATKGH